jgi:hypothetical protein
MAALDRKAEYERIGRERAEAERESRRILLRDLLLSCLHLIAWTALGLFIMFFAFYVTDVTLGRAFLYGGMAVGYAGIFYTLHRTYRRGEQRGDW